MSNAAHAPLAQPVPDQDPELPTVQANASEDARARLFWQRLSARPYQFDLMHSLRYLQARHPGLPRLGQATRPKDEPLRLGQDPSLAFAPATIAVLGAIAVAVASFAVAAATRCHLLYFCRRRRRRCHRFFCCRDKLIVV